MSELDLSRTTRFVSLDTHPANDALVVTYEITALIKDPASGRELCRRSKRDQFQVAISNLDLLVKSQNSSASANHQSQVALSVHAIREKILVECPMLRDSTLNHADLLEDVQLNLLYLVNRKQAQLAHPSPRPPSSAARLRSGTPLSSRRGSSQTPPATKARDLSQPCLDHQTGATETSTPLALYQAYCEKELMLARRQDFLAYGRLDEFVRWLDEHLLGQEAELQLEQSSSSSSSARVCSIKEEEEELETILESLYGELEERSRAMVSIREHVRGDDERLARVSSNRLLICAMLRILRDNELPSPLASDGRNFYISKSILYCLIRLTSFEDILFNSVSGLGEAALTGDNESSDLVRIVIELLDSHLKWLTDTTSQSGEIQPLTSSSCYTNSLLTVLVNLLRLDLASTTARRDQIKRRIIQQHGQRFVGILLAAFTLAAKHLARDIRNSISKSHQEQRLTVTLAELIWIARQFSLFKEFIAVLRVASIAQPLIDALLTILDTLQLSRPGSGSKLLQQAPSGDRSTLLTIYELEIELLTLISNLMLDQRFKTRLVRNKLLLKCVLRSLVVYLAAAANRNCHHDSLNPFNGSLVLIAPMRCLYELSCNDKIKRELYESRIIVKCLLEYLLSAACHLRAEIELLGQDLGIDSRAQSASNQSHITQLESFRTSGLGLSSSELDLNRQDEEQIVLNIMDANQYIVGLWINLSSRPEAPINAGAQPGEPEASEQQRRRQLGAYAQLTAANMMEFAKLVVGVSTNSGRCIQTNRVSDMQAMRNLHLMCYTHSKLIRHMTQHRPDYIKLHELADAVSWILSCELQSGGGAFVPLLTESLAALTNLISEPDFDHSDRAPPPPVDQIEYFQEVEAKLATIMRLLLDQRHLLDVSPAVAEVENDDLLMVVINLIGALAYSGEICASGSFLGPEPQVADRLIEILSQILELKIADTELIICSLFTLDQLVNHAKFLAHINSLLSSCHHQCEPVDSFSNGIPRVNSLIDSLCSLVVHSSKSIVQLSDRILNKLKQFEESQSLADSITGQRRFVSYNNKWLNAIRANREDSAELALASPSARYSSATSRRNVAVDGDGAELEMDEDELDEYRQLRAVNMDDNSRSWSRLADHQSNAPGRSSNSSRANANSLANGGDSAEDEEEEEEENDDDFDKEEEDEESCTGEPDANVIDSMSMINHLTASRQMRAKLTSSKH